MPRQKKDYEDHDDHDDHDGYDGYDDHDSGLKVILWKMVISTTKNCEKWSSGKKRFKW